MEQVAMRVLFGTVKNGEFGIRSKNGYPPFCCEAMESAWKEGVIRFGGRDGYTPTMKECEVAIWHWSCWPEGAGLDRFKIDFCPFCGGSIQVVRDAADR